MGAVAAPQAKREAFVDAAMHGNDAEVRKLLDAGVAIDSTYQVRGSSGVILSVSVEGGMLRGN